MNTRTVLVVMAVVAFAFVATSCLAATVDANKPCDANKPAEKKVTISVVDLSKYTEGEKGKSCDKDPNKKGCDKDANKATVISASDFGTYAKDANDVNKPAEPNKMKLAASEKSVKGKGLHKRDPNHMEPNKPAEPNKSTIISASDFGTYAKDANKPDANKPAEANKTKLSAEKADVNKPCDANKPAEKKSTVISASDFGTYAKDANDVNKPAEPNKSKMCAVSESAKGCDKDPNKPADANDKK